jgi:hypothetical protein
MSCHSQDYHFFLVRFKLTVSARLSGEGAGLGLMGFPAWPPGGVPGVEPGEDRVRPFHRHLADGAIGAAVDFLDEECAFCDGREIGIGLSCVFHFVFSLFIR